MDISIVVATDLNGLIGSKNSLPWRLPADMARFVEITKGHFVIMGRKTYESIGKPLVDRINIVLSRKNRSIEGVRVMENLDEALKIAKKNGEGEAMVIGGAAIYKIALPIADRIYLTKIEHEFEGDTYFPKIEGNKWRAISYKHFEPDRKNKYGYAFIEMERAR